MRTLGYGEFSRELHRRLAGRRIPAHGTIELTRRCPLSCVHCYNNLPLDDGDARRGELTAAEWARILDEIAAAGCLWLLFTGGEIFVRPDFFDIYAHAKRNGFLITLFTNATRITPRLADRLAEMPPFSIEVTLYGATAETFERVTRVPGSFGRCLRGIRLLVGRGLPVRLKSMALTENLHELEAMAELARSETGGTFRFDGMINCRLDCAHGDRLLSVRLRPEQIVALDLADADRAAEWRRFAGEFYGPVNRGPDAGLLYHCGAGVHSFAVDPSGRMRLCLMSPDDGYDLRSGSFKEGWEGALAEARRAPATRVTKCTDCPIKALCGMCPAHAELETGDPEEPVDFLCRVAHLRCFALGLPVGSHGECEYCDNGSRHVELTANLDRNRSAAS